MQRCCRIVRLLKRKEEEEEEGEVRAEGSFILRMGSAMFSYLSAMEKMHGGSVLPVRLHGDVRTNLACLASL